MKGIKKIILPLVVTASLILLLGTPRAPTSLKTRILSNGQAEINLKVNAKFDPLCLSKLEFSKSKKFDSAIYPFTIGHTTFSEGSIDFRLPGTPFDKQDKQITELFSRLVIDCSQTTGEIAYSNTETLNLSKQSARKKTSEDKFFTALTGRSLTYALKNQRTSSFETVLSSTVSSSRQAPQITLDLESASFKPDQDIVLRLGAVGAKPVRHDWYYTPATGGESIKIKNSLGIEIINDSLGSTLLIRASLVDTRQFNNSFFKVNTYNRFGSVLSSSVPVYISDDSVPTPVPSAVPTITPSIAITVTPTINPTATNTVIPSVTPTRISTFTSTRTATATNTQTATATNTRTTTATRTNTATATNTNIPVCTAPACSNGTLTCGNPASGCPGGCGYICVINPTPTRTATHTISPTNTATPTASKTATPTTTTSPSLSYTSNRSWQIIPDVFPAASGGVTEIRLAFNMSPSALNVNSLTGLSLGSADSFSDLAAAVRFAPATEGGDIDVRNGSSFSSSNTIIYTAGTVYRVEMNVDLVAKKYSVSVDGSPLATNYNFRTEQANVSSLNTLNIYSDSGSHTISNVSVELISDYTAVNGQCGSADGGSFRSAPSSNLCSAGAPGSVSRAGDTYIWTCSGLNSGSDDNCSASHDSSISTEPVRIPSFGPNGSHWPGQQQEGEPFNEFRIRTPFMYDKTIAHQINVEAPISWTKIKAALESVTPEMARAGTAIWVAPGDLQGNGSGGGSTPALESTGSKTWEQRVLVAPRDGYGTVTWKGGTRIFKVYGVAFAGFIAEGGISFGSNTRSALAWIKNNGYLSVNGYRGEWTHSVEIVEVVRQTAAVENSRDSVNVYNFDGGSDGNGGGVSDFYFDGNYFAPVFTDSTHHSDTLQFAKWDVYNTNQQGYGNMTIRDTAIFASSDAALQIGNIGAGNRIRGYPSDLTSAPFEYGLKLDNAYIVAGYTSHSRYNSAQFVTDNTPAFNSLNGSGKNLFAKDSILIGADTINDYDMPSGAPSNWSPWHTVSNTKVSENFNNPRRPMNGSFTVLPGVNHNSVYLDQMPATPDDNYLNEIWFTKWQSSVTTPTATPNRTATSSVPTFTPTRTPTATNTTNFATFTPTRTPTATNTSITATLTPTRTATATPTNSGPTFTPTRTPTSSPIPVSDCSSGSAQVITQRGVTWRFSAPAQCGTFVNGDYWVKAPVTVVSITTENGGGTMLNPVPGGKNGFHPNTTSSSTRGYDASLNINSQLPRTLQANDMLVSASAYTGFVSEYDTALKHIVALSVVANPPAAGAFRPPVFRSPYNQFNYNNIDWSKLKNLTLPASAPSIDSVISEVSTLPWIDWCGSYICKQLQPRENTIHENYGREIAKKFSNAALALNMNYPQERKQELAKRVVQAGIDIYGYLKNGQVFTPDGGHKHGRKMPILLAGVLLNDAELLSYAGNDRLFQEDMQTFMITDYDVGRTLSSGKSQYTAQMVGCPEWGVRHGTRPEEDNSSWDQSYRTVNGSSTIGSVLAARIMGIESQWSHDPTFIYWDRYFDIEKVNAGFGANNISTFVKDMWDLYRNLNGVGLTYERNRQYSCLFK